MDVRRVFLLTVWVVVLAHAAYWPVFALLAQLGLLDAATVHHTPAFLLGNDMPGLTGGAVFWSGTMFASAAFHVGRRPAIAATLFIVGFIAHAAVWIYMSASTTYSGLHGIVFIGLEVLLAWTLINRSGWAGRTY